MILAIDPGTTRSAWVLWDPFQRTISRHGCEDNHEVLDRLASRSWDDNTVMVVEMIASYGMPVGAEVFETCVWIGRFVQAWSPDDGHVRRAWRRLYRREVKLHLCGSARARDANVRQALLDLVGPRGTKCAPGPTYGLRADEWAALGVAVTAAATPC